MAKALVAPLRGHGLLHEGWPYTSSGKRFEYRGGEGYGQCACGAQSPWLPSDAARKRWHREHKRAIQDGGPS